MITPLIILVLLISPYYLLQLVPAARGWAAFRGCVGLAAVFCFTGVGHFVTPVAMSEMIPPFVPFRLEQIYVTGVIEILAGLALIPSRTRRGAGWFLLGMLVLLLPFNVYAAFQRLPFGGYEWGPIYLWIRVPLQFVLGGWCYVFAVEKGVRKSGQ